MPRRINLAAVTYLLSMASIATGVGMLLFVLLVGIDEADAPPGGSRPEAVTAACPEELRRFDNRELRYTVCLPPNLLYYDGANAVRLDQLAEADWPRAYRNFILVNEAWLGGPSASVLQLQIEVVPPDATFDGCDLRGGSGAGGVMACADAFVMGQDGPVFVADGPLHRFRALVSTQPGKPVNEVWSLYLSIASLTAEWPAQQPLFQAILESLKPY